MGFLTELYFGNLEPQAKRLLAGSRAQRALETLSRNEALLSEKLEGEQKRLFLEYANTWAEVSGTGDEDSFCTGFRLGAACAFDVLRGKSDNFESFLKE